MSLDFFSRQSQQGNEFRFQLYTVKHVAKSGIRRYKWSDLRELFQPKRRVEIDIYLNANHLTLTSCLVCFFRLLDGWSGDARSFAVVAWIHGRDHRRKMIHQIDRCLYPF